MRVASALVLASASAVQYNYTQWVIYNDTKCTPADWIWLRREVLGECYYSGPKSWRNNCTADGQIMRTFYDDSSSPADHCAGKQTGVTHIQTSDCTAYEAVPGYSQEFSCNPGPDPRPGQSEEGTMPRASVH